MKALQKSTGLEVKVISINFENGTAKISNNGPGHCVPLADVTLKGVPGFKLMTVEDLVEFVNFFGNKPPALTESMLHQMINEFIHDQTDGRK